MYYFHRSGKRNKTFFFQIIDDLKRPMACEISLLSMPLLIVIRSSRVLKTALKFHSEVSYVRIELETTVYYSGKKLF